MSTYIMCSLLLLCSTLVPVMMTSATGMKRYDNYQVIQVTPKTVAELDAVKRLTKKSGIDFWKEPTRVNASIDVMVPPFLQNDIYGYLKRHGLSVLTLQANIQDVIDADMRYSDSKPSTRRRSSSTTPSRFDYSRYHTWDEVNSWMDNIVENYPNLTEIFTVTNSYEGRRIRGVKILGSSSEKKKAVFFEGGIHSREWISPATMIFFIKEFVENYGKDRKITKMVDAFDWYIVPILNPDGYVYTWTTDRLWRKSREPTNVTLCFGVDLNRNWDYHWGEIIETFSGSSDPCSILYFGPKPNSSIEVTGTQTFLTDLSASNGIALFIDWHSYSQLFLSPWGYTRDLPEHYQDHMDFMEASVDKLVSMYGTRYKYGSIANTIYVVSGSSSDWVYGTLGVKHSYGVELRDTFTLTSPFYGFLLPEKQIIPTAVEAWESIKAGIFHLLENDRGILI